MTACRIARNVIPGIAYKFTLPQKGFRSPTSQSQHRPQGILSHMSMTTAAVSIQMPAQGLVQKDEQLVRLFLSICCHKWDDLVLLSQRSVKCGASSAELLGCIRHICVVAGYPPALAAVKKLHGNGFLQEKLPGKAGGTPGNAFELVYATKTDKVYDNLYRMEPVVSEWIRCHCYGDIYSSPGLSLRQKQLMISAFLGEADMHEEYFGHVIAGIRFGSNLQQMLRVLEIAFEIAGTQETKKDVYRHAVRLAEKAARKVEADFPEGPPREPSVTLPDAESLRVPKPPASLSKAYFE